MAKTAKEIQTDFYTLLKGSSLAEAVNGGVYRDGMRPRDSKKEDIVIIFSSGEEGEIQSGIVTLNIYVPDITPYRCGTMIENAARTATLERAAQDWYEGIKGAMPGYLFRLYNTIHTAADEDINQHFIVAQIKFKFCNS
jgi:hypothetical protein